LDIEKVKAEHQVKKPIRPDSGRGDREFNIKTKDVKTEKMLNQKRQEKTP